MTNLARSTFATTSILALFAAAPALAQIPPPEDPTAVLSDSYDGTSYSPYTGLEAGDGTTPNQVLWGDTHLHTSMSMDAGAFGNRLGIDVHGLWISSSSPTTPTTWVSFRTC
jgi:hypothetical protein